MNKDFKIVFEETYSGLDIYLVPKSYKISMDSMWKTRIGHIDFEDKPSVFRFVDSKYMTLEVMRDIVFNWGAYNERILKDEESK